MGGRACLLVAVVLGAACASGTGLSVTTPLTGLDAAALGSWEKFAGLSVTATERVSYELYVNPARAALYEVTRYRVSRLWTDPAGRRRSSAETEKFLWNARPGAEHLRCFELLADGTWVQMKTDSPRYRTEMGTAIHVYGLRRRALGLAKP